jgi:hypothetical protein
MKNVINVRKDIIPYNTQLCKMTTESEFSLERVHDFNKILRYNLANTE